MAAPGSFFAVLMVKAVLTELTFGAAVSSRMMKFWNVTKSGATHFEEEVRIAGEHIGFPHNLPFASARFERRGNLPQPGSQA